MLVVRRRFLLRAFELRGARFALVDSVACFELVLPFECNEYVEFVCGGLSG